MSLTEDVALLLAELGHGVYVPDGDSTIFLGKLPAEPVEATAVAPYPGATGNARVAYDRPRMQIVRRSADLRTAEDAATAIYGDLAGLRNRPLGPAWLVLCSPVQNRPYRLEAETDNDERFVVNVELHLHQPTVHRS